MNQQIEQKITRIVSPIGNGSHVIVPKEWEGDVVMLKRIPKDPKKQILRILEPYLSEIIGVYLYGSYARKEQNIKSDVDIIVITEKKIRKTKQEIPYDFIFIEKNKLNKIRNFNPILYYSFLKEAKPLINASFLEKLRKEEELPVKKKDFLRYLRDTREIVAFNEALINMDKEDNKDFIDSGIIYSLILRYRGLYIIDELLKNKKFSNKIFLSKLKNKIAHNNVDELYDTYRLIRNGKKVDKKIAREKVELLIDCLNKEINHLEKGIKKNAKQKKKK